MDKSFMQESQFTPSEIAQMSAQSEQDSSRPVTPKDLLDHASMYTKVAHYRYDDKGHRTNEVQTYELSREGRDALDNYSAQFVHASVDELKAAQQQFNELVRERSDQDPDGYPHTYKKLEQIEATVAKSIGSMFAMRIRVSEAQARTNEIMQGTATAVESEAKEPQPVLSVGEILNNAANFTYKAHIRNSPDSDEDLNTYAISRAGRDAVQALSKHIKTIADPELLIDTLIQIEDRTDKADKRQQVLINSLTRMVQSRMKDVKLEETVQKQLDQLEGAGDTKYKISPEEYDFMAATIVAQSKAGTEESEQLNQAFDKALSMPRDQLYLQAAKEIQLDNVVNDEGIIKNIRIKKEQESKKVHRQPNIDWTKRYMLRTAAVGGLGLILYSKAPQLLDIISPPTAIAQAVEPPPTRVLVAPTSEKGVTKAIDAPQPLIELSNKTEVKQIAEAAKPEQIIPFEPFHYRQGGQVIKLMQDTNLPTINPETGEKTTGAMVSMQFPEIGAEIKLRPRLYDPEDKNRTDGQEASPYDRSFDTIASADDRGGTEVSLHSGIFKLSPKVGSGDPTYDQYTRYTPPEDVIDNRADANPEHAGWGIVQTAERLRAGISGAKIPGEERSRKTRAELEANIESLKGSPVVITQEGNTVVGRAHVFRLRPEYTDRYYNNGESIIALVQEQSLQLKIEKGVELKKQGKTDNEILKILSETVDSSIEQFLNDSHGFVITYCDIPAADETYIGVDRKQASAALQVVAVEVPPNPPSR